MKRETPAKINLYLRIAGQRPDGYHLLETYFAPIRAIYDTLTMEDAPAFSFAIDSTDDSQPLAADDSNLCVKAAHAFQAHTGIVPAVHLTLTKRIPISAGLGGGSSDAAATLRMLNDHYGKPLSPETLWSIARTLGADVSFFLNPLHSAVATGIGDELEKLPLPCPLPILIIHSPAPSPVAWAFKNRLAPPENLPSFEDFCRVINSSHSTAQDIANVTRNDLEYALLKKFPLLQMMVTRLLDAGAYCAHVSGSGNSLFAIVPEEKAKAIQHTFAKKFPGYTMTYGVIQS